MTQDTEAAEKYAGLDNKEILLVYYRLENYLKVLNKNLEMNVVTKQVETPMGIATAMKEVPKEHVEKFKETEYYITLCEVVNKLKPVVDIITECDDSIKKLVETFK
jgi:CRISPR/Cas system-associated protein Cas7 (RAMP superfamily)